MRPAIVLFACACALMPAPPAARAATPAACPATFDVLAADTIGTYAVPAGAYRITVLDPAGLSCANASDLLRQFLEDFNGTLPAPWTLDASTGTFSSGPGNGFSVALAGPSAGGGGGQSPATGVTCPTTFSVLHQDHIGSMTVPRGPYAITVLSYGALSCGQAFDRFARFLQDFDGVLPSPWTLDATTGTFQRGGVRYAFRVSPAPAPIPATRPTPSQQLPGSRCPGVFSVRHDDRIGALRLPQGDLRITRLGSSCAASARLLAQFLGRPGGRLPSPWRLDVQTGTFTGTGSSGFRIKPV
jgi:hypothetical protein